VASFDESASTSRGGFAGIMRCDARRMQGRQALLARFSFRLSANPVHP
jgi:hypothetical protein